MMKGIVLLLTSCSILAASCSTGTANRNNAGTQSVSLPASIQLPENDGKIIEINEKLFIAQTNDIYLNPEDYMGRTIKLEGLFKSVQYEDGDTPYCFVLRYGPGCCGSDGNAGFEVAWDNPPDNRLLNDDTRYTLSLPDSKQQTAMPREDDWVEAVGVLKSYEEDGYPYLYLSLSSLDIKETRGAEFVSQ
ncbi:MAG: hypothetical protein LBQ88_00235 [Treponema sp.]|jgi:hypothetical protein|nr:hypothetical protein [Treponema sp.]